MRKNWILEVWGDYACFSRPEMKVERVSYDVMTPSAARAIFDAILWKPVIKWRILKIVVLNPIRWISVRRNEIEKLVTVPTQAQMEGKNGDPMGIFLQDHRQQRAGLFLRDVRYQIHARYEFIPREKRELSLKHDKKYWADSEELAKHAGADETEAKYAAMFERRVKTGKCLHRPYLGCREFACHFRLIENNVLPTKKINPDADLGWMLYDMDYTDSTNPTPEFFKARLENNTVITDRQNQNLEIRS
jgi:CRISPR-associated protein Cas5d